MSKLMFYINFYLMLSVGLFTANTYALDVGKVLEDAAKQVIDSKSSENAQSDDTKTAKEALPIETPAAGTSVPKNTSTITSGNATAPASNTGASDEKDFNWRNLSQAEEIALGRNITGSLLGAAPLIKDDALQQYVNKVGRWVASQSERADLPWKFGVIESSDLNAFAAPGGYVIITKGLYQKMTNEAQLAGVLGHEIAHVVKKHQLKVLQKQQLLNYGAGKLKDLFGKNDKLAKKAISSGAEVSARGLDKEAEFEADRMGMVLASRAGYDAYGLAEIIQTMAQTNKGDSSVALLFKTHPAPDERLLKLSDSASNKLDNVKAGKTLDSRFYKLN